MNNVIKKFKKITQNETKRVGNFLKREFDKIYDSKKIDVVQEVTMEFMTRAYVSEDSKYKFTEKQFDKLCDELKSKFPEMYQYYDDLCFIEDCFKQEGFFNSYNVITALINKFGFDENEKPEIYAFFLNITIKHILEFHRLHQDHMQKVSEERASKKLIVKVMKKTVIKKELEKHTEEIKRDQATIRHLRNVIDPEGNIIPFEYATDLIWVFEKEDLDIDMDIAKSILTKSEDDFRRLKEESNKAKLEFIESEKVKCISRQQTEEKNRNIELLIKERRIAVHKLKEYFKNDLPIKFITDLELLEIIELLKVAGYTELQINAIKKSIVLNNAKIVVDTETVNLNNARDKFLSGEMLEIYNIAESILLNNESLKNTSYNKLEETYNLIKSLLIELTDKNAEDLELLVLYIDELRNDILNYSYSDYRNNQYSLLLKKEQ